MSKVSTPSEPDTKRFLGNSLSVREGFLFIAKGPASLIARKSDFLGSEIPISFPQTRNISGGKRRL